jgi:hypothetical protein
LALLGGLLGPSGRREREDPGADKNGRDERRARPKKRLFFHLEEPSGKI